MFPLLPWRQARSQHNTSCSSRWSFCPHIPYNHVACNSLEHHHKLDSRSTIALEKETDLVWALVMVSVMALGLVTALAWSLKEECPPSTQICTILPDLSTIWASAMRLGRA